jgi:hypothetical protein
MLRLNFVPITPFAFVLFWSRKIRLFHIANSGKDGGIYIARDEEQNTKLTFVFFHLHIMQMYRVYSVQDFFYSQKKKIEQQKIIMKYVDYVLTTVLAESS